jgi:hypothetical protein
MAITLVDNLETPQARSILERLRESNLIVIAASLGSGEPIYVRVSDAEEMEDRGLGFIWGRADDSSKNLETAEQDVIQRLLAQGFWANRFPRYTRYASLEDVLRGLEDGTLAYLRSDFLDTATHSEEKNAYFLLTASKIPSRTIFIPIPQTAEVPVKSHQEYQRVVQALLDAGLLVLPRGCKTASDRFGRMRAVARQAPEFNITAFLRKAWEPPLIQGVWQQIHTAEIAGDLNFLRGRIMAVAGEVTESDEGRRLLLHLGGARVTGPDLSFDAGIGTWTKEEVLLEEIRLAEFLTARGFRTPSGKLRLSDSIKVYKRNRSGRNGPFATRHYLDTEDGKWLK